jgi:hypothetical protein
LQKEEEYANSNLCAGVIVTDKLELTHLKIPRRHLTPGVEQNHEMLE